MRTASYQGRREQLEAYFDKTAARAWEHLTSDAPVSRIRETVRAGRDQMSHEILQRLPKRLDGRHVLDAGCGTGNLSIALAARGATVTAIDISTSLIEVARGRTPEPLQARIDYRVGDMLGPHAIGFDHIVCMDSLIHYTEADFQAALVALSGSVSNHDNASLLFTFAPRTPLLMMMKHIGKLFPKRDRSPAIEPIAETVVRQGLSSAAWKAAFQATYTRRIDTPFYKSQLMELTRP